MKKLVILGESHTRSFAYRKNILPFFMGSGKDINLDKSNIKKVNTKIKQVLSNIDRSECLTFLYLGEPNCRLPIKNHWTPHWDELHKGLEVNSYIDKQYLKECLDNMSNLELESIDYIITPTGAYDPVQPALLYFNNLLKEKYNDKVIDIFSKTIDDKVKTKNSYKAKNWIEDPIHVNSKVAEDFLKILSDKNIIDSVNLYNSEIDGYFGTHLIRNADKSKFGSYVIKKN